MKLIKCDIYLNQLISKRENGLIKVVTGMRRCGKSCLLESGIKEDNIITLALDDDLNRGYRNPNKLSDYLHDKIANKNEMPYILLDEIQFAISEKGREPIRLYGEHHI